MLLTSLAAPAWSADWVVNNTDTGFDPVTAGGNIQYSVRVNNNDVSNSAPSTTLTIAIPATTTFVSAAGLSCSGTGPVTCTVPALAVAGDPGDSATVQITIRTSVSGSVTLDASVPTAGDTNTGNNSEDEQTTVNAGADIDLSLSGPASAQSGSSVSYTWTILNNGPNTSSSQTLTFPAPTGLSGISAPGCALGGSTYTCTVASLASGASSALVFTGQISAASGSTITPSGSIVATGAPVDPVTSNNTDTFNTSVTAGSDLRITKAHAPAGTLLIGQAVTFTLTPTYTGDSPSSLTITDTLPANYTLGTVTTPQNGWTCGVAGQTVTCTKSAGTTAGYNISLGTITIPATASSAGAGVVNSATIAAASPSDPIPGNNTGSDAAATIVAPTVDLRANKSGPSNPALVVTGTAYTYSISASNIGTAGFDGTLVMTDDLPAGITVNSYTLNGWSCLPAAPVTGPSAITCQRTYTAGAQLAAGGTSPAVTLNFTPGAAGTLVNSMTVSSPDANIADNNAGNDTVTYTVNSSLPADSADLRVLKSASPGSLAVGDVLTYTIEIVNDGPQAASTVSLTDSLTSLMNSSAGPTGSGYISESISAGTATGSNCSSVASGGTARNLTCTFTSIPACTQGSDCPVITVQVRPGGNAGTRSNTASALSTATADPTLSNNSGSVSPATTVTARADVIVGKTATPASVPAGQNLTYVVTATNVANGLSAASNVTITDTLPNDLTFVSATPSSGTCATKPTANSTTGAGNNQVICNLGTINNGAQSTVTILVRPNTVTRGTSLTNNVDVTTTTTETDSGNNSGSVTSSVQAPELDLLINKVDSVDPVAAGDDTVYTVSVQNQGPSSAENVVVTDTLPGTRLTYQSHTVPTGGSCSSVPAVDSLGGTLTCGVPYLAAGQTFSFTVTMRGIVKGTDTNSVSVSSTELAAGYDTVSANNTRNEPTTVRTKADVQVVSKTPSSATVNLRDDFDFVVKVRNNVGAGLAEADDVVVSDTLPTNMQLVGTPSIAIVSGTTTSTTCTGVAGGTSFTCNLGTLSSGGEVDITVPVQLVAVSSYPQTFNNTASVTTSSLDTVPANNSNSGSVSVNSSSLAGRVFRDFNNDGLVTAGDTGISGITVTLSGTSFDGAAVSRTANTDANGNYSFTNIPQGSYSVTEGAVSEAYLNDGIDNAGTASGTVGADTVTAISLNSNTAATGYNFAEVPQARIGIAKTVITGPIINADGTFNVSFRLQVENFSLESLNSISVTDQLSGASPLFGTHVALAAPGTDPLSNGQYTLLAAPTGTCGGLNSGFNGNADTTAASGFSLTAGATCRIDIDLRARPNAPLPPVLPSGGRYENQAIVNGTGALSGQTSATNPQLEDSSDNGSNPDPDNDNRANETGENDPTPVAPTYAPAIGIAKQLNSAVSIQPDFSVLVPVRLLVENIGNEPLSSVAVNDALATVAGGQFGSYVAGGAAASLSGGQYTVQTAPAFSGACTNGSLTGGYTGASGSTEMATITAFAAGASCTLDFTYRFMPAAVTTYTNQATASGTSEYTGTPVTDSSDNGSNPDTDGDNNANEAGENDPTPVPYPRVALAKRVNTATTTNADGTVTVPFQLLVRNTGGETLNSVSLTDDVSGASPQFGSYVAGGAAATLAAGQYTVQSAPAFSGACTNGTANAAYTGDATQSVASISSLAVNASCTVNFSLRFRPQAPLPGGGYSNQALASGTGAQSGLATNDQSDDGVNPDTDNDGIGNEAGENDPTPVSVSFTPRIGLAKTKPSAETINTNGTVTVPFRVRVQNYGTEPLVTINVSDLLAGTAPAFGNFVAGGAAASLNNGEYTIQTAPSLNGACAAATLTPGFTGAAGNSQIASLTRLEVGAACEFDFTLRFRVSAPPPVGGYSNVATGAATGELSGGAVNDVSNNGANPDSNGNGDPTDDNVPTPVNFSHTSAIGIAKTLRTGLLVNGDGSYTGSFRLVVENHGNEELDNVNVSDPMSGAVPGFGTHVAGGPAAVLTNGQYTIQTTPAFVGACATGSVNAGFDGSATPTVVTIGQLAIDGVCTIDFSFRFVPQPGQTYTNQSTATGTGTFSGATPTDSSDDGTSTDPDADGNANEAGENDPTPVPIPRIGVAKSAGAVVNNGDGTYSVPFTLTVNNAGGTSLASVQVTDTVAGQFGVYTANAVPAAGQYTLAAAPTVSGQINGAALTAVAAGVFTGSGAGNALLVPASSSLPSFSPASRAQILFTVRFFPTTPGPFNNTALATGTSPAGGNVRDDSVDGTLPDADANGSPEDDTSPTVVSLSGQAIGIAKSVTGIVQIGVRKYRIPYTLEVRNVSTTVTATNVQVTDSLSATFPTAQSIAITSPATVSACSGTVLTANAGFNGIGANNLLTGNQNLQPGEHCAIAFTTEVDFGANSLPNVVQNNQATATTHQTPGGTVIASDLSDNGVTPDADGDGNANEAGENDPTPVSFTSVDLASLSGTVYLDANHDRSRNDTLASDRVQGFTVEVLNSAGTVVGETVTDASGAYTVAGLFPSTPGDAATYYSVRFREPANDLIYGIPQSADSNPARNGIIADGIITQLQLAGGVTTLEQNLPLDPSGVVYNSVTRSPIAGAQVTLLGNGVAVAGSCLVGGANTQTTGPSGEYQFLLINPVPVGCPGNAVYTLQVVQPGGYLPPASAIIPPQAGNYTSGTDGLPDAIQAQPGAPAVGQPTTYYMGFNLNPATSDGVVNNHVPLDPVLGGAIALTKTTPLVNVNIGQLVPWTITASNTLAANLTNIDIRDTLPPGFKYKVGSATLNGVAMEPSVAGRVLTWSNLTLAPNATRSIKLITVVGAGVQPGEYVNTARAHNNLVPAPTDNAVSNIATASVRVIPDTVFDCSDLIGKVFDDRNVNGYQDEGEPGIANVRLATARGWLVTTDAEGRFSVPCAAIPDADRGSNFIMKLDERTLPTGYRVTTENPRDVRLTRGKLTKLNFGAAIHKVVRVDMADAAFEPGTTALKPDWKRQLDQARDKLKARPTVLRLGYKAGAEGEALARERLRAIGDYMKKTWKQQACCHTLQIEEELFLPAAKSGKGGK